MRTAPALLVASVLLLALSSCVRDDDPVIPTPLPSSTPIFASDEEALAAAEEAYGAYLTASDEVGASGGVDLSPLEPLVTDGMFTQLVDSAKQYTDARVHTAGSSTFDSLELQQYIDNGDGSANVSVYVCLDVSHLVVLDESDNDVTPSGRDPRLALEVAFLVSESGDEILLERSDLWDGADFCDS